MPNQEDPQTNWKALWPEGIWEAEEQRHNQCQPMIKDAIIHALQNYVVKSFSRIGRDNDGWCCASTIHSWLKSKETYSLYTEQVLPLLSSNQQKNTWNSVNTCAKDVPSIYGFTMTKMVLGSYHSAKFEALQ
jgi:hypothetical protein